jgi:hypothetical protein
VVAGNGGLPCPSTLGGECLAGAFDGGGLKPLDQIPGRSDVTATEIGDVFIFRSVCLRFCKYPPAEPGALGIGPLEAATLDPKLYLFGRRTKYSLPTSPRPFIQFFLHHFGEQMPLDSCVAT